MKKVKIENIETLEFTGDVYNLELESNDENVLNDDLFWVDDTSDLITHNCFPKDLGAMSYFANTFGVDETLLTTIEEMNKCYRTNRDWETMKGRAVSDD